MKIKTVKLYELSLPGDVRVSLTYPQLQALHSLTSELLGMGVVTNLPDARDHVPHMTDRAKSMAHVGDWLGAVKEVRNASGCTLMEAKDYIETWGQNHGLAPFCPKLKT